MDEKWYKEKLTSLNDIMCHLQGVQYYVLENATEDANTYKRLELLQWTFRQMDELQAQLRYYEKELKKLRERQQVQADAAIAARETEPCKEAE